MVLSWLQQTGSLAVGGNSKTIRLWDLASENCTRIFHTGYLIFLTVCHDNNVLLNAIIGLDTCTTVLNSKTITADLHLNYPLSYQAGREAAARNIPTA